VMVEPRTTANKSLALR